MTTLYQPENRLVIPGADLVAPDTELVVPPNPALPADGINPVDWDEYRLPSGLYLDPPNINWGRAIPPERDWPGRRVDEIDVAEACGDGRDWFRFWHRIEKHRELWAKYDYWSARRTSDDYYRDFEWNQRLIMGPYGAGKTTTGVLTGIARLQDGFPFFHNGPSLVGWVLEGDEIFTTMAVQPPCSYLLLDEANTTIPGRLVGATGVAMMRELAANIRKINCQWDIVAAQWYSIHPAARLECFQVLQPFSVGMADEWPGVDEWDNPSHFNLAWMVWEDYPFQKPEVQKGGLDAIPYDYWCSLSGDPARDAFALTDSFRRVNAGEAALARSENIKNRMREIREDNKTNGRSPKESAVNEALDAILKGIDPDESPFIRPGDLAYVTGLHGSEVGRIINDKYGIKNERNKGYSTELLMQRHQAYEEN